MDIISSSLNENDKWLNRIEPELRKITLDGLDPL